MISTFSFPTAILHGAGTLDELPERLSALECRNPLVVTDPGLKDTPAFHLLRQVLPQAEVFSSVHPNPISDDVTHAVRVFQEAGCDGVVGFGGGSALDAAKILRAAAVPLSRHWSELTWRDELGSLPPFIAIPTTAGTGSEVGRSSVITFEKTKKVIFHPALLAQLVILDPRVTEGLPPLLTAATGADALTHCIESFTSPVFHPLCDAIALEGFRIAYEFLPQAVDDGTNLHARGMMQIAATMGGIAFQKDLGATHSLSHPLSAHFGINHGLANALCLIPVMRFNAERKPGLYRRLGIALGIPDPYDIDVIDAVQELLRHVGLVGGLRARGIEESTLELLAEAAYADGCHATNPVPVTLADLRALYAAAW